MYLFHINFNTQCKDLHLMDEVTLKEGNPFVEVM